MGRQRRRYAAMNFVPAINYILIELQPTLVTPLWVIELGTRGRISSPLVTRFYSVTDFFNSFHQLSLDLYL